MRTNEVVIAAGELPNKETKHIYIYMCLKYIL